MSNLFSIFHTTVRPQNRYSTRSPTPVKTCPNFFYAHVQNTPSIRHFDAILTPSWQVSPALLTFRRHLPVTKADVLLTFCTYKVLYAKKPSGKNYRGNLPGGVLMATMRCARRHARGDMREATCARTPTSKVPTRSRTSGWLFILWCGYGGEGGDYHAHQKNKLAVIF